MTRLLILLLLLAGVPLAGQDAPLYLRVGHAFTGRVSADVEVVLIQDGKIAAMGLAKDVPFPQNAVVIDAGADSWVLPGFVLADDPTKTMPDGLRSVAPELRAADGFDPFEPAYAMLSAGVTSLYLAPGNIRLLSGQGAVVRTGAKDPFEGALIQERASLHGALMPQTYAAPIMYDAPITPGPDNPLSAGEVRQFPSSRSGAALALRTLFRAAKEPVEKRAEILARLREDLNLGQEGISLEPFERVLAKTMPFRVRADDLADIRAAISIASEFSLPLIIDGGRDAWRVAAELGAIEASVVLTVGRRPGSALPPPPPFAGSEARSHPEAAGILRKNGVKVALVSPNGTPPSDLLLYARTAMSDDFDGGAVLAALTSWSASILGVQDHVGLLQAGRMADLTVWDRDPIKNPSARPLAVIADGRLVRDHRDHHATVTAIGGPGATIHLGDGATHDDHWVLVEGDRIVDVTLAVPSDARRVPTPGQTITPGFVDASGQVGLRSVRDSANGEIAPGPKLQRLPMNERPTNVFDPEFPDVAAAARAGVTTVALTPAGGGAPSGVLSVVKATTSKSGQAVILSETAGILMDYGRTRYTESANKGFKAALDNARKYAESWTQYEKELAAFELKNPGAASEADRVKRQLGDVKAPEARDALSGTWEGTVEMRPGLNVPAIAKFTLAGESVTGSFEVPAIPGGKADVVGTFVKGVLTTSFEVDGTRVTVTATVARDEMIGTWTATDQGSGRLAFKRTEFPPAKEGEKKPDEKKPDEKKPDEKKPDEKKPDEKKPETAKADDGKPKAPRAQPELDPFRPVFEKKATLFIAVSDERLGREMLAMVKELGVDVALLSPEHLPSLTEELKSAGASMVLNGQAVRRDRSGDVVNPARIAAWNSIPAAFCSGIGGDCRALYEDASYAVAHGLSSHDALRMMTLDAAKVLHVEGRVGSITRGKDADLVIFSGAPFAAGTRIVRVMVNGRFMDEEDRP